jgi:hypothetical protein
MSGDCARCTTRAFAVDHTCGGGLEHLIPVELNVEGLLAAIDAVLEALVLRTGTSRPVIREVTL